MCLVEPEPFILYKVGGNRVIAVATFCNHTQYKGVVMGFFDKDPADSWKNEKKEEPPEITPVQDELQKRQDAFLDAYANFLRRKDNLTESILKRRQMEVELLDPKFDFKI